MTKGVLTDSIADKLSELNAHRGDEAIGMVMSYEAGGSLSALLHPPNGHVRHPLSLIDKVRLCRDLGNGIACLHNGGIVHGDVKPDNILLSSLGTVHASATIYDMCDI